MKYELWNVLNRNKTNALAKYLLDREEDYRFTSQNLTSEEFLTKLYTCFANETPEAYAQRGLVNKSQPYTSKDLRIEYLKISWFRGIPVPQSTEDRKTSLDAFGISLGKPKNNREVILSKNAPKFQYFEINPDTCNSLVLLGSNGSGKTSIYSAIELLCTGSVAIEKKHKIKEDNFSGFRHYLRDTTQPFKIELKIKDEELSKLYLSGDSESSSLKEFYNGIDLSPFFCSESDLAIFECSGKSVEEYVDEVCGLGEIQAVIDFCDLLIDKGGDLEGTDGDGGPDSIEKQVARLAIPLISVLRGEREGIRESVLVPAQKILEELLSDFEDRNVELSYAQANNGLKYFNGKIKVKANNKELEPREYYNNFRFKLYLISLRIGIAFYIMRSRNIKFPLIFDDIFDSSDFPNRVQTKHFFQNIVKIYSSEKISESLLQIIFFTQDEIIAESVFNGIYQAYDKNKLYKKIGGSGYVILGRLFPAENWDDERDQTYILGADGQKISSFINLFDQIKQHVYQLYYETT